MARTAKPTPPGNKPARYSRTSTEWPCIFKMPIATERLDPAVKKMWESQRDDRPKWGDLRNTFRRQHCYRLNPWGSETCPFKPESCALAFYEALRQSLNARNPYGYFISVCRSSGALRADLGVELRARMRTDVSRLEGAGLDSLRERPMDRVPPERERPVVRRVDAEEPARGLRGSAARPTPIGDLLGSLGLGSHPRPGPDSDEDEG